MLSIALELDPARWPAAAPLCDDGSAKRPDVGGVLSQLCLALADTGALRFKVMAFDDEPWPVDVACDLAVLLEQLSDFLQALRSPAVLEFELSFYEQGIERDLLCTREASNRIVVDPSSRLPWTPVRSVEIIEAGELDRQLVALVDVFATAARVVCPALTDSPVFQDWLAQVAPGHDRR